MGKLANHPCSKYKSIEKILFLFLYSTLETVPQEKANIKRIWISNPLLTSHHRFCGELDPFLKCDVKQEEDELMKSEPEGFCEDLDPVLTTKFVTGNWIKQEITEACVSIKTRPYNGCEHQQIIWATSNHRRLGWWFVVFLKFWEGMIHFFFFWIVSLFRKPTTAKIARLKQTLLSYLIN